MGYLGVKCSLKCQKKMSIMIHFQGSSSTKQGLGSHVPCIYVTLVCGTRVRWIRGYEYSVWLEASPKFAGNVGLGAAIIYTNFFKIY